jgi:hypothetical protein
VETRATGGPLHGWPQHLQRRVCARDVPRPPLTVRRCALSARLLAAAVQQALKAEASGVERTTQRICLDIRSVEAEVLRLLSEQTSAEKSSAKTAVDVAALRAAAEAEEVAIAEAQNELARLAVDALNTEGHNERLRAALALLDADLKERVRARGGSGLGTHEGRSPRHALLVHAGLGLQQRADATPLSAAPTPWRPRLHARLRAGCGDRQVRVGAQAACRRD